jgi:putative hydrolase of the HAD superfamily
MEPVRYPFVLFDAGETLFGPRESFGATYARVLGPMGIEAEAAVFENALREVWDGLNRVVPPGADRYRFFEGGEDGYWLRVARGTIERARGGPITSSLADAALRRLRAAFREPESWEVFPDVVPALALLRGRGVRMGIVSNWDSRLPDVLRMLDLDSFFDAVVVSHLEGIEKPNPEIFRRAVVKLRGSPEQTLHVGDVPELDLEGARAAGIHAVLVDRRGRLGSGFGALRDFSSLPRIVQKGVGSC